jgi:hypothetical protein
MKSKIGAVLLAKGLVLFALTAIIGACSRNSNNGPVPQPTKAEILVQAGKWVTTGGTLVAADSTSVTLSGNDTFFDTILLGDVTFYANGTAVESNDPNGLTANGLTWSLNGSNLLVNVNFNNTDKVRAVITYLSDYKLVLNVSDFYVYKGVTYVELIQTMGH